MAELFKDIIPSIMQTKKPVLTEEKDYLPFMVNRAVSHHYDCIIQANLMNLNPHLDKKLQFDFLINSIRGYKRPFQKWQKRESDEKIDAIKEFFGYSNERAKEVVGLLSDAQIDEIKRRLDRGGTQNRKKKA
jgi:hypothetical protein